MNYRIIETRDDKERVVTRVVGKPNAVAKTSILRLIALERGIKCSFRIEPITGANNAT